ncbi:MAG: biotin-dependent carboxyltransferase family protein, partial [Bacteroidota bacterium]
MSEPSTIKVIAAGLFTTIQDLGRLGAQAQGVPIGGVLDRLSARQANYLVGNPAETPVLEITLTGPTLQFSTDTWIAICGGSLEAFLGTRPIHTYRSYLVRAGEVLRIGRMTSGVRSYLAIGGEWQVERWLGSAGAWAMGGKTFPEGALLQKGQAISIIPRGGRVLFIGERERTPHQGVIRVLAGPEWDWFSQESQRIFLERRWRMSNQSNRMAQKLEPLLPLLGSLPELISSPVWPGTIQCTAAGQLI